MTDLISRQAAIKYLMTNMNWYDEDGYESDEDYKRECITELINGVPPAEPRYNFPEKPQLSEESTTSDCISRQDAIDALEDTTFTKNEVRRRLLELPSAQTEIIRCRDCKHYQFADNRAFDMPVKLCEWFGFEDVDDDDFCSRAERREE